MTNRKPYFYLRVCPVCGNRKQVQSLSKGGCCKSCAERGEKNRQWKGGRKKHSKGAILVKLYPGDPFFSMADVKGYVRENRLVMARRFKRLLRPDELVHHINKNQEDNAPENPKVLPWGQHTSLHNKERYGM